MVSHDFTALLKKEMVPARGCTGPVSYALAGACCRPYLTAPVREVRVFVSPSQLKIGFGVATPGTSRPGIDVPAALGLISGDWTLGLSVLDPCTEADVEKALSLVDSGTVKVLCAHEKTGLYIRCEVDTEKENVVAVVSGRYDGVSLIRVNGETRFSGPALSEEEAADLPEPFTLDQVFSYLHDVDPEEIRFLLDGYRMNLALAEDGLRQGFGLRSGRAFLQAYFDGRPLPKDLFLRPFDWLPADPQIRSRILVAAASDARMGGSRLPAMAAMGDGNQGLTAMIPVGVTAEALRKDDAETIRALALSCLTLFFVKLNIGRESSFCLCSIAASSGVAAGVGLLRGLNEEEISSAVKNTIAPLCGMLCDGAKNACALKMQIASDAAFSGVRLAEAGVSCGFYDGVADDTLEGTVSCVAAMATESQDLLDAAMVRQILKKTARKRAGE